MGPWLQRRPPLQARRIPAGSCAASCPRCPGRPARLPPAATGKLTIDTVRAARVPAAVHFAFTGTAKAVEVVAEAGERTSVPAPTLPQAFVARVPGQPAVVVPLPAGGQPARIPLPERDPAAVVRLYLPEAVELQVSALSAIDGDIAPAPRGPLWVVYGDSVSQGWSVTEPGLAWPSLVAAESALTWSTWGSPGRPAVNC